MLVLGLNETMYELAMTKSARWYSHVLSRELDFEVDGQRNKSWPKETWKKHVDEESIKMYWAEKLYISDQIW